MSSRNIPIKMKKSLLSDFLSKPSTAMRKKLLKNYYKGPTLVVYNKAKAVYFLKKKKDNRSVIPPIDVTLIFHIVCHIVANLTCNKDDVRCRKHSEQR